MTGRRVVAVIVAVLGVAACTGGEPPVAASTPSSLPVISAPAPAPTPSVSPSAEVVLPKALSAKEREAALEAVEAYRRFVDAHDAVSQSGGKETDRLLDVAIDAALSESLVFAERQRGRHGQLIGDTQVQHIRVVRVTLGDGKSTSIPEVIIRSCEDLRATKYVDEKGVSLRTSSTPLVWDTYDWVRRYPTEGGWLVSKRGNVGVASC